MSGPAPRHALQQRVVAAILDGAAQIFALQGEHASMTDVAEAAGSLVGGVCGLRGVISNEQLGKLREGGRELVSLGGGGRRRGRACAGRGE